MMRSLPMVVLLVGTARAADRPAIEQLFTGITAAVAAGDAGAVVAAYDPAEASVVARAKTETQSLLALSDPGVSYRVGSVAGGPDAAEAVVLRRQTYSEHGRRQVEARWQTVALRRLPSGWKIASEEERTYARAAGTDLAIELHPDEGTMRGSSRIEVVVAAPGEDSLLLTLNRGLEVTSIADGKGRAVRFVREANAIEIPIGRALRAGDRRTLNIAFAGKLFNESQEQGYSQVTIAPAGAFASWVTHWYPRLVGEGSKSKGRIRYIDFSFAAARYFHREEKVDGVQLGVYLLRGGDAKADLYLKQAARILRYQRDLYGGYPFDGYAIVEVPPEETGSLGGSSEQGMNLFPAGILPDDQFPLLLLAHEMGHSWWGNLLGSADGPIIDEGLAQMSAVMCLREIEGEAAMRRFLEKGISSYDQSALQYFIRFAEPGKDYPIGLPGAGSDAAAALHDLADTKGMFVYNMLREAIGQEAFAGGLRAVATRFAGRRVRLVDLRAAWESASGKSLQTFFRQWMERTGAPELSLESKTEAVAGGFTVSGVVRQQGDLYDLTVEIALAFPGRHEIQTVAVSGASTPFSFRTREKPAWVVLDPAYKILRWTPAIRHRRLLTDGVALQSLGRKDACARLDDFAARAPDSLEGQYRAGRCAQQSGKLAAAERSFRGAIDRYASLGIHESWVTLSQLGLGQVLDLARRREEATAAYRQVLTLPDAGNAHRDARAGLAAPYAPPPAPAPPGREALLRFAGNYGKEASLRVAVKDDGLLMASWRSRPESALVWLEGSRFRFSSGSDAVVEFGEDSAEMTFGGRVMRLPKTK